MLEVSIGRSWGEFGLLFGFRVLAARRKTCFSMPKRSLMSLRFLAR